MKKIIKCGIIGTGEISRAFLNSFRIVEDAKLSAVCDLDRESAKQFAAEFGELNIYEDYRKMITEEKLDMVCVCTPKKTHYNIIMDLLDYDVAVLSEKPVAQSLREIDDMIRKSKEKGRLLGVAFQNRFLKSVMRAKHALDTQLFGKNVIMRNTFRSIHGFDTFGLLLGELDYVSTVWDVTNENNPVIATFMSKDGKIAIMEGSYSSFLTSAPDLRLGHQGFNIDGTELNLWLGLFKDYFVLRSRKPGYADEVKTDLLKLNNEDYYAEGIPYECELGTVAAVLKYYSKSHYYVVRNFIKTMNGEEELITPIETSRKSIEMVTAAYKSAALKKQVCFPIPNDDEYYESLPFGIQD